MGHSYPWKQSYRPNSPTTFRRWVTLYTRGRTASHEILVGDLPLSLLRWIHFSEALYDDEFGRYVP
jgi:hypothetical protein